MSAWGKVRLRRTARPSTAVTLGLLGAASFCLLVSAPALAAPKPDPLPVPKPQPKQPPPPPRQPAPPPPPTFEPPPPPAAVSPQPSAAEIASAERRAAEVAAARRRAAKRRADAARAQVRPLEILPPSAAEEPLAPANGPAIAVVPAPASPESGGSVLTVFLVGLAALALVLLAIALVPAHMVPWYWAEDLLVRRRQQFAISGVMSLLVRRREQFAISGVMSLVSGIFFAFIFLSS